MSTTRTYKTWTSFCFSWALALALLGCDGADAGDTEHAADTNDAADSDDAPPFEGSCSSYSTAGARSSVFFGKGASPGNSCELEVAPCGGELVGNWGLDEACGEDEAVEFPPNPFMESCPGARYEPLEARHTGMLVVDENDDWVLDTTLVYDYEFGAEILCLGGNPPFGDECGPEAEQALSKYGGSAKCEGQLTSCTCIVTNVPLESEQRSGRIGAGGTTLEPDDAGAPMPYCVADRLLHLWTLDDAGVSEGEACGADLDCDAPAGSVGVCVAD